MFTSKIKEVSYMYLYLPLIDQNASLIIVMSLQGWVGFFFETLKL